MMEEKSWISSEALFSAVEELLDEKQKAVFIITGMSMWPFLCHGRDQVIVKKCDFDHLKKGDVILFQTPFGNYILHRITSLTSEYFETTGDGNCFRDGQFPISCIKAQVSSFIRKEKIISCDSALWKIIFKTWELLFPVRRYLLWILMGISHIKNHLASVRL